MSGADRIAAAGRRGMWLGGPLAAAWLAVLPPRAALPRRRRASLITASTTVGNDLAECPADGLVIGAGGVRLDVDAQNRGHRAGYRRARRRPRRRHDPGPHAQAVRLRVVLGRGSAANARSPWRQTSGASIQLDAAGSQVTPNRVFGALAPRRPPRQRLVDQRARQHRRRLAAATSLLALTNEFQRVPFISGSASSDRARPQISV
jgi:hypothetical protein